LNQEDKKHTILQSEIIQRKDIFSFNLYEAIRPNAVSYMKGQVYDKKTGKLLKAEYELINLSTGKIIMKSMTDETGNFLVCPSFRL